MRDEKEAMKKGRLRIFLEGLLVGLMLQESSGLLSERYTGILSGI